MNKPIRTLGLFEGVGGFPQAAHLVGGFEWLTSIDIDSDAVAVLRSRFNHDIKQQDIRSFTPTPGVYDFICGGFPCSGTSNAGTRTGLSHPSSALFREFIRCICQARPLLVCLEQPMGFEHRGIRAWLGGMRMAGYQNLPPFTVSADVLGASYQRERIFVISYANSRRRKDWGTRWSHCLREVVQEARDSASWLTVESRSDRSYARIPDGLVQRDFTSITCPTGHPGRLKARILGGKTVTPPQAVVALRMCKWLWDWQ
ncbi:MAG: DNA cytosine methyltransferase [Symploca sp. SIO2E6]|nr:DNA cytosine methyltransferase [Symploca sp. SIO2E6]